MPRIDSRDTLMTTDAERLNRELIQDACVAATARLLAGDHTEATSLITYVAERIAAFGVRVDARG